MSRVDKDCHPYIDNNRNVLYNKIVNKSFQGKIMSIYIPPDLVNSLLDYSKQIVSIRNQAFEISNIDILDTDSISSLFIYEIVRQYDPEYNINFSRNGEDASSGENCIEQKTSRVRGPYTKTGKIRKGYGLDALWSFHAMGEIKHSRYLLVTRNITTMNIMRIYDISNENNCNILLNDLLEKRNLWLERCSNDTRKMRFDVIHMSEAFIINNINFTNEMKINNCVVFKD